MERWETINAVQRMQDYMEEHIYEPMTMSDLAKAAGYSQWHSARIFKELTGKSPFAYLRALRLSKAALVLRDEKTRVIDVAFDFVFDSQDGFSRAFSRQFGISPQKYRNNPPPIPLFIPYGTRAYHLTFSEGGKVMSKKENTQTVFVQVVERPERKAIIRRGIEATDYFKYCEEVGCDVWGVLSSIKEAMYEPIGMWLPPSMIERGTSQYVQGVEVPVDYRGEAPEGFEIIELPPGKMMVFQGEPFDDEDFMDAITDLWEVMKKYDPQIYGFEWADEDNPRFQMAPMGYRGYIEARPVRQISG